MEMLVVLLRTGFFYLFIVIIFRLMGKREIAQLSVQDLVVSILIAELVAISIENIEDPLMMTVIPIGVLVILEISASFISLKSQKFRRVLEGKPSLIINKGKINFKEMVKQRYTIDDLLLNLRANNIKTIEDIEYAILEIDGTLSIFKYNFLKLNTANPLPLVIDGVVQEDTLKYIKKDKAWLYSIINDEKLDLKNIFYCFYKNNKPYLIKRSDLI